MIKVLLADDHQLFLDGMRSLLEKDTKIEVIGTALDGNGILELLDEHIIDVVILDVAMPNLNGIETTELIKKKYPKVKVLILTMYNKKDFIVNLMKHGASGYILKNKTEKELLNAIHNVYRGGTHFSLEVLDTATSIDKNHYEEGILTEREQQVLIKIAEGYKSREISDLLHISEATVNTHRRNILAKLNLPNVAHLVRYAIKHGHVEL